MQHSNCIFKDRHEQTNLNFSKECLRTRWSPSDGQTRLKPQGGHSVGLCSIQQSPFLSSIIGLQGQMLFAYFL